MTHQRWQTASRTALAAGLLLALVAAPAAADRDGRRYKGGPVVYRYGYAPGWRPARVVIERHDGPGPVLAGFVGGLVLGNLLSQPACPPPPPPPPPVSYVYEDPYCHEQFATYDDYLFHLRRHHHPRIVEVLDARTGAWVDTRCWRDGAWVEVHHDRDWDDEDGWGGDDD